MSGRAWSRCLWGLSIDGPLLEHRVEDAEEPITDAAKRSGVTMAIGAQTLVVGFEPVVPDRSGRCRVKDCFAQLRVTRASHRDVAAFSRALRDGCHARQGAKKAKAPVSYRR